MSRAYGWNASLLIAEEIEYGVMPKNGYTKIPFISSSLDSEQSLVTSNVLGLGRDPTTPFQDVINVSGDIVTACLSSFSALTFSAKMQSGT